MDYLRKRPSGKWQDYVRIVVSAYRLIAFAIAAIQAFVFSSLINSLVSPVVLITLVGVYSLFKVLHPIRWQEERLTGTVLLIVDVAVCFFTVISTGGIYSPFLLYTLTPVLTAAMLARGSVTLGIAGFSAAYVIGGHLVNPFFHTELSLSELSYFFIYLIAAGLTAALPYLINVNLRQRLQTEDTLQERQRLARELHDSTAQTLAAVCWQVQLLRRRLNALGYDFEEMRKLELLTAQARQDTRDSLETLRNYNGTGTFIADLNKYLEHFKRDTGIDFSLEAEDGEPHLLALAELELLRICQEALANIRKHASASRVRIGVARTNGHYTVSIADNGHGFDSLAYSQNRKVTTHQGQGLSVMRERAESVGGRFRIISAPGKGAEVQVEVPAKRQRVLAWLK